MVKVLYQTFSSERPETATGLWGTISLTFVRMGACGKLHHLFNPICENARFTARFFAFGACCPQDNVGGESGMPSACFSWALAMPVL